MVNFKETITKLHSEFPEFDLAILLKIMECIVEESKFNISNNVSYRKDDSTVKYPWATTITYSDQVTEPRQV